MLLRQIFDPKLAQYAYLIACQQTGEALVVDPERDIDRYLEIAASEGVHITAVAETHIHADFLSGAREMAEQWGVKVYLSDEGDADWKYEWAREGDYDVQLLKDGDRFEIGKIELRAVHTPGHTPEHLSFVLTDRGGGASEPMGIATGDFVFVGDLGRPDLLESAAGIVGQRDPSARALYRSLDSFLELPDFLQVWPAHGAGSACGKALGAVPTSTVGYEKRNNAAIDAARRGEEEFVEAILEGQPEPPLYFATMKRLNKMGPPVLGGLPAPRGYSAGDLAAAVEKSSTDGGTVVVDTRADREGFMRRHLVGSLFAPLDRSFPTITGSYITTEQDIVLILEPDRLEEAVRDLVRIGLDRVVGYSAPSVLEDPALAGHLRSTPVIDFEAVEKERLNPRVTVLDVRGDSEYAAGHIPGSVNIAHTRLLERLDEVPSDGEVLVHCKSGARASAATALLERMGRKVTLINDAFADWDGPVETGGAGSP